MELVNKFECQFEKCQILKRSREQRVATKLDKRNLYITKLDDIHSYFLQFSPNIILIHCVCILYSNRTQNYRITILHSSSMIYGCDRMNPDPVDPQQQQNEQTKPYETPKSIVNNITKDSDQNETDTETKGEDEDIPTESEYRGEADMRWLRTIDDIDIEKDENKAYKRLIRNGGIFRWQGSTGFTGIIEAHYLILNQNGIIPKKKF